MYTEYQPSRLLAPYIDNYWEFKGTPEYGMRIHILPDGCTDFIFTLGEAVSKVKKKRWSCSLIVLTLWVR